MDKVGNASTKNMPAPSPPPYEPSINNLDLPKSIAKLLFKKIESKFINSQLKIIESLENIINEEPILKEKYFSGIYLAFLILQ